MTGFGNDGDMQGGSVSGAWLHLATVWELLMGQPWGSGDPGDVRQAEASEEGRHRAAAAAVGDQGVCGIRARGEAERGAKPWDLEGSDI